MEGLFDNGPTCGFGALGAALLLIILGYVVMSKIADIEV